MKDKVSLQSKLCVAPRLKELRHQTTRVGDE